MLNRSVFLSTVLLAVTFSELVSSCIIDLKHLGITTDSLPEKLEEAYINCPAKDCTQLSLNNNDITVLPPNIFDKMTAVVQLYLQDNNIKVLPPNIFDMMTSLKMLYLHNNDITVLPPKIFYTTALHTLYLDGKNINVLPPNIFDKMTALHTLILTGNNINVLPPNIFDKMTALRTLYLTGTSINVFPPNIFDKLTALHTLNLSSNKIKVLPPPIFDKLTALHTLILIGNTIRVLPPNIFDKMTAMERLILTGNNINVLPPNIFDKMTALHTLDLTRNTIRVLPPNIFDKMTAMEQLYLPFTVQCTLGKEDAKPGECFKDASGNEYLLSDTTSPTKVPTSAPTKAPTNTPTSSPTDAPTEAPTSSPTSSPTDAPKAPTSSPTSSPTDAPKAPTSSPTSSPTDAPKAPTSSPTSSPTDAPTKGCDLSRDGGDIAATELTSFNVLDGNAVVIITRELEWGQDEPDLVTDVAGCADQFTWTSEESPIECEYEEWTGSISVTDMLKNCTYSKDESSAGTTVVTIDFAIREERDIDLYMGSIKRDVDLVTTKNSMFPLSLKFKKVIDVTSSGFSVTQVMYDVTTITVILFTPVSTDADKDLLKAAIETYFGVPSAATKLKVTKTGFVYEAPGDLKVKCDALNLGGFPMDTPVCTVKKEFLNVAEVQKRSVVYVTLNEALIPTAYVSVYTLLPFAFQLSNPSFVSASQIAGLTYGDINVTYGDGNDFCPPDAPCPKNFNFQVQDNSDSQSQVCTFSGEYEIEFKVKCVENYTTIGGDQAPLECPLDGTETITITLDMESYDHCPETFDPVNLELKSPSGLVSYRGDDVADKTSAFLNTQTLRFYADVLSNNAELEEASFISISVENVNNEDAPVVLFNSSGASVAGAKLSLNVQVVNGSTDPTDENSFLRPSFDFVADTDNPVLLVALTKTAVFKVTGTIEVRFKFEGKRRRMLLQTELGGETLTTSRTVVLGGDAPMLVLEQSAAHGSVSAGFMLALLSAYTVFALHI